MFLWLCVAITLISAETLENDEITQRLGDILNGSSESDDQKMDGQWYQIATFQANEDQNECEHLIITENITTFLDENCKETLAQSTSQKNQFKLIKTSFEEFLAAIHKNKEDQTDSLALYGRNIDPEQLQQKLPNNLGNLLLKPCDKIYKDCTRKVRNTKEKCDNIRKSFKKADSQAQIDYMDDYFTICTINNTDYISYDDVLIPIEPSIKDSDKENQQSLISNKIENDTNPERSHQERVKELLADDPSLSENDKATNHQNISLDKNEDKNSPEAKMNDTPKSFERITSDRPPQEYAKELADDPSLSENNATANHKNINLGRNEYKNSADTKTNETSERLDKITSNELKVSDITNDSSITASARMFGLWNKGSQKSTLDEKNKEDESDSFNSGSNSELSAKHATNSLEGLLNKVNSIVEKAKALSSLAKGKAYNANENSTDIELKSKSVLSENPAAKVRENNTKRTKAASRDYLFVTTPHTTNDEKWMQSQTSVFSETNNEGSGDYLFPETTGLEDKSQNRALSTDSNLFEKYSKLYNSLHNSNTKDHVVSTTAKIVEKQDLTYNKTNENNTNTLPYDDFGEYLPTISHSSSDNNDNRNISYTSESSDMENATPFEIDISNISITTTDASDSSSGDTSITRNFNEFNITNITYNGTYNITNTTYNGTYSMTSMPTTQTPDIHPSSSMSPIIDRSVVVVMMLINFFLADFNM